MTTAEAAVSILEQLGSSRVRIEISAEQVEFFFKIAIMKASAYLTEYELVTIPYSQSTDLKEYKADVVYAVYEGSAGMGTAPISSSDPMLSRDVFSMFPVFNGGLNSELYTNQILMNSLRADLESRASKNFRYEGGILYLDQGFSGVVTVKYSREQTFDSIRDPKWKSWIYEYAMAMAKVAVGRIRSKIRSSNLPIELDGDTILSEGNAKIQELEERLNSLGEGSFIITR